MVHFVQLLLDDPARHRQRGPSDGGAPGTVRARRPQHRSARDGHLLEGRGETWRLMLSACRVACVYSSGYSSRYKTFHSVPVTILELLQLRRLLNFRSDWYCGHLAVLKSNTRYIIPESTANHGNFVIDGLGVRVVVIVTCSSVFTDESW